MKRLNCILCSVFIVIGITACNSSGARHPQQKVLSLAGDWQVKLDPESKGESEGWADSNFSGKTIALPGTLDDAQIGNKNTLEPAINNEVLSHLTREYEYIGVAWYQREIVIPDSWKDASIDLELERVLWESTVFVDGDLVGQRDSLVASHDYDLTEWLTPGEHLITVRIDNSDQHPTINYTSDNYPRQSSRQLAHAYTNHTQIKWNGVVGDIKLTASPQNIPHSLQVYPDIESSTILVQFSQKTPKAGAVAYQIMSDDGAILEEGTTTDTAIEDTRVTFTIDKPEGVALWDEFNPNVYRLAVKPEGGSGESFVGTTFGFREVSAVDGQLRLNNQRLFLRGNLDTAAFPLTGYPPTEKAEWLEIIQRAKTYGLNHFRFHSWTPPSAAFEAADEAGFYFQVELPHWSHDFGANEAATDFLKRESQRIIDEYGNHPSFILMAMGNELQGDVETLKTMVNELKSRDVRHIYTSTAYSLHKPRSLWPLEADQFYVASRTEKGWIRGQGFFNDNKPSFDKDHSENSEYIDIPMISHEIGQYAVFPDMSEIPKYTGVLKPLNFIAVREQLEQKNLIDLAGDFTSASGKLAAILYKEEIERALKTPGFDGFQLLQLQDFPGQGTALVGLLNVFWDSKGVISAEEFRAFNSELVPLIRFNKAVYESGETFTAHIEIANFFKKLDDQSIRWSISSSSGKVVKQGEIQDVDLIIGNNLELGSISQNLEVAEAEKFTVEVELADTEYQNSWSFWVYPKDVAVESSEVIATTSFEEAETALKQGKKVFLNPDFNTLKGVEGRFVPVFWSPVQFPDQAGTMGLLMDPSHQAFAKFPTAFHTDWQWWDLAIQSRSVEVDESQVTPIVRVIDNFVTNRHLANVVEAKVGEGKLIFSSIDLTSDLANRPAARQLRHSLLNYMESGDFDPQTVLDLSSLQKLQSN